MATKLKKICNIIVIIILCFNFNAIFANYSLEKITYLNEYDIYYVSFAYEYNSTKNININNFTIFYVNPSQIYFNNPNKLLIKTDILYLHKPEILYKEYLQFTNKNEITIKELKQKNIEITRLISKKEIYILHIKTFLFKKDIEITF